MADYPETIHVRVSDDTRQWLSEHFPARGDISWLVRELLNTYQIQVERGEGSVSDIVVKAIERSY